MLFSSIILFFTVHLLTTSATSANSSHASSTESCRLRDLWRTHLEPSWFDPTHDCWGLNKILGTVYQNRKYNFCAADADVVSKYINSGLSALKPHDRPRPCEVHQWYYSNYDGKLKKPFCQHATEIAVQVYKSHNSSAAHTNPYLAVFHGPRTTCNVKFKSDLESIGNPDLAGTGVLVSQFVGMVLLCFVHLAALWPKRFLFATSFLKTIRYFYVTAVLISFSTATAALITFWRQRSRSKSLHDNFGYVNFYANSMLALGPILSIMSAIVLVMIPAEVPSKESGSEINPWGKEEGKNIKLFLARLAVTILYIFCMVVSWVIWLVGVRDQHNPTRIVFGDKKNVRVSNFIYEHASTYVFSVCTLMSALPAAGLAALATLLVWHDNRKTDASRSLSILRDRCRDICVFFGTLQLIMVVYIRGQAIHQAGGATSEMDWGFGQIVIVFTWLPLLSSMACEIFSPYVDRLRDHPFFYRRLLRL